MSGILNCSGLVDVLAEKIESRTASIGVVGLGYVGLPLINAFTNAGFHCIGFDVDWAKVQSLKEGQSYIKHVPSSTIQQWLDNDLFEPTAEMARLKQADTILICVPTPLNASRDPDLKYIECTGEAIAAALRPGQLIVLESTTRNATQGVLEGRDKIRRA